MPATIRNIAIAKKSNQRRTSMLGSVSVELRQQHPHPERDCIGPVHAPMPFGEPETDPL
jgi:hypothetical protein